MDGALFDAQQAERNAFARRRLLHKPLVAEAGIVDLRVDSEQAVRQRKARLLAGRGADLADAGEVAEVEWGAQIPVQA